jgi:hypothetical protein
MRSKITSKHICLLATTIVIETWPPFSCQVAFCICVSCALVSLATGNLFHFIPYLVVCTSLYMRKFPETVCACGLAARKRGVTIMPADKWPSS